MDIEHLCLGCMSYIENKNAPCPNCGWHKNMKNFPYELEAGYTLSDENHSAEYIIGRSLGQNDLTVTYLAWSVKYQEKVVVKEYFPKVIATRNLDSKEIQPYKNDIFQDGVTNFIETAHKMLEFSTNPNIVKIKNFFRANNTAYLVTEYVEGQTLYQILQKIGGRLKIQEVLSMLNPLTDILEEMHFPKKDINGKYLREPLIHQNINPDSIIFTSDGTVKLLECGTLPSGKFVNPQSDIYSLAAAIYYSITGIEPRSNGTLIKPSDLGVAIEKFQEDALLKGLESDYRKSYQSVKEFMKALQGIIVDPPNPNPNDTRKIVGTIFLLAFNLLIMGALLLYEIDIINEEYEDSWLINLYDFITEYDIDFSISLFVEIVSSICLVIFIIDIWQIYKGRKPQYLSNAFLQDVASLVQIVCVFLFIFIIFFYYESWDEGFIWEIRLSIFLNSDMYSDETDLFVNLGVLIYIVSSIVAVIFGRQILRKNV